MHMTPVDAGNLFSLGPPCKDLTRKNNAHKAKAACVAEGSGASGSAMHHVRDFLKLNAPLMVLLEQVKGCTVKYESRKGRSNYDDIVEILVMGGYMVRTVELDSSIWIPQQRVRIYFVGIHMDTYSKTMPDENLMERMDEFVRVCNEMSADGRLPPGRELTLDDFIMPLTHPSCQLCYDEIVMKASKIDAAIAADEGAYRAGRPKKCKLDADEDDHDDANADSSSTPCLRSTSMRTRKPLWNTDLATRTSLRLFTNAILSSGL